MNKTLFLLSAVLLMATVPAGVQAETIPADYLRIFTGEADDDRAGTAVDGVGDLNGDGYEDIIVGAPFYGEETEGAIYIIYGKSSKWSKTSLGKEIDNIARLTGEDNSDKLGEAVSALGDVNGDGYDDAAVGTRYHDQGGTQAGVVYIIYGQSEKYTDGSIDQFDKFIGSDDDLLGTRLSAAGDLDGDGYDDFLMGAPWIGDDYGTTFVVYGDPSGIDTSDIDDYAKITGVNKFDRASYGLDGGGDINGDGYDDILIGARLADDGERNSGSTYIVYGSATRLTDQTLSGETYFVGETTNDKSGEEVAFAGDVNGDGYDDFLIASPTSDYRNEDSGSVYLVYGKAIKFGGEKNIDDESVRFYSNDVEHLFGFSMDTVGDINGDGYDEFIVGAPGNTSPDPGKAYVVYGKSTAFTDTDADDLQAFEGIGSGLEFGYDVSGVDVNGDGEADIVVGAQHYDNNGGAFLGYLPIYTCENSAENGGILADYPKTEYKHRNYAKNDRLQIVVEINGQQAHLVNCVTDEILQTLTFNENTQRKILARVFVKRGVPVFVAATRTKNKRSLKIYFYKQKKENLELQHYIKRKWRPRGFRIKLNNKKQIKFQKGKEKKHQVLYRVGKDLQLELLTDN